MNRRGFLKAILVGTVAATVPMPLTIKSAFADISEDYGVTIDCGGRNIGDIYEYVRYHTRRYEQES